MGLAQELRDNGLGRWFHLRSGLAIVQSEEVASFFLTSGNPQEPTNNQMA
jgi:hypothetical protein